MGSLVVTNSIKLMEFSVTKGLKLNLKRFKGIKCKIARIPVYVICTLVHPHHSLNYTGVMWSHLSKAAPIVI